MKKTTKQVREALREKQPFAFTCRRLPMCVSPRICGAGICVEDRMFLACTTSLTRKVDVNLYQLPARYAAAVASLLNELWNTSAITEADFTGMQEPAPRRNPFQLITEYGTGSLHLVVIGIDGARIDSREYRMLHSGGQKSIDRSGTWTIN